LKDPASWSTFYRVYRKVWGAKLRFRKGKGQHPTCDVCLGLKKDIKEARSLDERHAFLQRYMSHVFEQWQDRMVYWALCTLSCAWCARALREGSRLLWLTVASSCATIIIDGVDQAKFRIPRIDSEGRC